MKRDRKQRKWLGYILSTLWIFLMGLSGFFFPSFIDNIEFFKIKALQVEGLETIPSKVVVEEIGKYKNNWLFITNGGLLKKLNSRTGNAVRSVKINRVFASSGVELRVVIEERKPVFTLIKDSEVYFFDKDGVEFKSEYVKIAKPFVYTHNTELVKRNFNNLIMLISSIEKDLEEIYITNLNTVVYTKEGLKINMPPVFLINQQVVENLVNTFKVYNVDANTKELDLNIEGIAIIRKLQNAR